MIGQAGPGGEVRSRTSAVRTVRFVELARHAVLVGIAGVVSGVAVGGVGGRILMRISAIAAPDYATGASTEGGNVVGEVTVGGTLALIVFVGILLGLVGAIAYLISEPWLAWTGSWRAPVFGVLLLVIGSTSAFDPGNRDFLILGNQELNVAMFIVLFLAFGAMIVPLIGRLERSLPAVDPSRPIGGSWGYLALAAFGLQFLFLFFIQFFDADASGAETAPVGVGVVLIGLALATLLLRVGYIRGGEDAVNPPARFVGHGLLLLAVLVGGARAVADIAEILAL